MYYTKVYAKVYAKQPPTTHADLQPTSLVDRPGHVKPWIGFGRALPSGCGWMWPACVIHVSLLVPACVRLPLTLSVGS